MDGNIEVRSNPKEGSEFKFTMKACIVQFNDDSSKSKNEQNQKEKQQQFDASIDDLLDDDLMPLENEHQQQNHVQFQGINFDFNVSRTIPVEVQRG